MKPNILTAIISLALSASSLLGQGNPRKANTIILDDNGVKNLRIQTAPVESSNFEETVLALGRIEAKPDRVAAVASRISGRVTEVFAFPGDTVEKGADVLKIESRQPGNPAPVITLTAPLSGMITKLDVRLGDPVEPDRPLAEISDFSEVLAVARVPEYAAGRIQIGATAHINISALPGKKFTGQLLRFGTLADETGGTLDAVFVIKNEGNVIRPGMRGEFAIIVQSRPDVVSVPRSALQGEGSSRFVYVKDFDLKNAFVKTPVVIGQSNERFVEILNGLLTADEVVTQGAYSLAFVGGGTVSLKAALDAAHGHEHNEDGSEMTAEQRRKSAEAKRVASGEPAEGGAQSPFWMIVSGVLFVLLLVVSFRKKPVGPEQQPTASSTSKKGA